MPTKDNQSRIDVERTGVGVERSEPGGRAERDADAASPARLCPPPPRAKAPILTALSLSPANAHDGHHARATNSSKGSFGGANSALRCPMPADEILAEFDRQVENVVDKDYPRLAGLGRAAFKRRLAPLKERVSELKIRNGSNGSDRVPFAIVIGSELVPAQRAIAQIERRGKSRFSVLDDADLRRFAPIDGTAPPSGSAHLVVDVDTGADTRNVTPDDALARFEAGRRRRSRPRRRSPS